MVFSSFVFITLFLPAVLILHTVIPNRKVQNGLLLAASLLFYAFGEPLYVLLMLGSTLANYLLALLLNKHRKKWLLALAVAVNLALLGVFKYAGFLAGEANALFGLSLPVPQIALPIGISFFTFQALSYVVDVYRGDTAVQKSYFKLLLYISFFPQLIAGPIVRYRDIAEQIDGRTVDMRAIAFGLRRFIAGLGKKVLIANTMGAVADTLFAQTGLNALAAWLGAVAYLFQIYYDFSGYSDMAIGLGKMFGFQFRENFNHPYIADSVQEFWRRWHISLSSFFRDYVYIPLGGNRKGKGRAILNRIIVFALTGLWHGANRTFLVWGLFHGFFLLLETAVPLLKKLPKFLRHVYTLLVVTVGFVIFRADSLTAAAGYLGSMFAGFDLSPSAMNVALQQLTPWFMTVLLAAVLGCGVLGKLSRRVQALEGKPQLTARETALQRLCFVGAFLLFAWCIVRLAGSSYNPFIYFRF